MLYYTIGINLNLPGKINGTVIATKYEVAKTADERLAIALIPNLVAKVSISYFLSPSTSGKSYYYNTNNH